MKKFAFKEGDQFLATNKLDETFLYSFEGIVEEEMPYGIKLFNKTLQETTMVEEEWFNQRGIVRTIKRRNKE